MAEILGGRKSVTEGVWTSGVVARLAVELGVEMPICAAVDSVINRDAPLEDTIRALLSRPFRSEGL